ncbi:MAG: PqqD family protein [Coriobacteriales bacterium]|jgi:hypothetical protein|nr:PqqD family protein [Coriobacteriales bacterium]
MGYRLSDGIVAEDVDGTTVLTISNGDAVVLNEMAGIMLESLLEAQDIDAAVMKVAETYTTDAKTVKLDIDELVAALTQNGVLSLGSVSV